MSAGKGVGEAAGRALARLVDWLPGAAAATADDVARFGPNAARVRALLDFIPTMSDDAAEVSKRAWHSAPSSFDQALLDIYRPRGVDVPINRIRQADESASEAYELLRTKNIASPAKHAAAAEAMLMPENIVAYKELVNPIAAGRAVDLLRNRARYQDTPFLDVVRGLSERGAIANPRDVVRAGRLARSPELASDPGFLNMVYTLMDDGMSLEDAIFAARRL